MKNTTGKKRLPIIVYELTLYFLILLSFSMKWCTDHFGNISMGNYFYAECAFKRRARRVFSCLFCRSVLIFHSRIYRNQALTHCITQSDKEIAQIRYLLAL